MPSRTIHGVKLHHWEDSWYTSNGRYVISTEGQTTSRCGAPHLVRNGMMCPGDQNHIHSVWWVWDSLERNYPMGLRSFDTLPQAVGELDIFLRQRGR